MKLRDNDKDYIYKKTERKGKLTTGNHSWIFPQSNSSMWIYKPSDSGILLQSAEGLA